MKQETNFESPTSEDLNQMSHNIAVLKRRAKDSQVEAKEAFETQVRALEDQYDVLIAKMNKTTHQADKIAGEMQDGVSKAKKELKTSFERATEYLH